MDTRTANTVEVMGASRSLIHVNELYTYPFFFDVIKYAYIGHDYTRPVIVRPGHGLSDLVSMINDGEMQAIISIDYIVRDVDVIVARSFESSLHNHVKPQTMFSVSFNHLCKFQGGEEVLASMYEVEAAKEQDRGYAVYMFAKDFMEHDKMVDLRAIIDMKEL